MMLCSNKCPGHEYSDLILSIRQLIVENVHMLDRYFASLFYVEKTQPR